MTDVDNIRQQLVRYEALFNLMNEILSMEDVESVAKITAKSWKFIANVSSWHLVVAHEDQHIEIDGSRGTCSVKTIDTLSDWDEFQWQMQIPRVVPIAALGGSPRAPEHLAVEGNCELQVLHYRRAGRVLGLMTVASRKVPFEELDNKIIRLYGKHLTDQLSSILDGQFNQRLFQRLSQDPATGLLNAAAIHYRLDSLLARSSRLDRSVSVVIVQIQDFDSTVSNIEPSIVNDALAYIGSQLRANARSNEVYGTLDRETFITLIFPANDIETSHALSRIPSCVSAALNASKVSKEASTPVVSVGLANCAPGKFSSYREVVAAARENIKSRTPIARVNAAAR